MNHQENLNLVGLLQENKRQIDRLILEFLPTSHGAEEIANLYSMMRDYPSRGGKGLRGTTCLLWCQLFGGNKEDALTTAAALELFQNWILIHDDIEDNSDLRRGQPTLHKKTGIPLAINTGDALHGKMWEILLRNSENLSFESTLRILAEFSKMLNETTEGQQMELSWTAEKNWNITESDYLLMVTKKSAWYTCISPCRLGVVASYDRISKTGGRLGSISELGNVLDKIISFGTDLGIAFQIIDDVLNLTADQGKYGKEILGDIFEGKRTLMLIHMLRSIGSSERSEIIRLLSRERSELTNRDAEMIFERMTGSGSIDYARRLAQQHSKSAIDKFNSLVRALRLEDSNVYTDCKSLIEYLTMRDY